MKKWEEKRVKVEQGLRWNLSLNTEGSACSIQPQEIALPMIPSSIKLEAEVCKSWIKCGSGVVASRRNSTFMHIRHGPMIEREHMPNDEIREKVYGLGQIVSMFWHCLFYERALHQKLMKWKGKLAFFLKPVWSLNTYMVFYLGDVFEARPRLKHVGIGLTICVNKHELKERNRASSTLMRPLCTDVLWEHGAMWRKEGLRMADRQHVSSIVASNEERPHMLPSLLTPLTFRRYYLSSSFLTKTFKSTDVPAALPQGIKFLEMFLDGTQLKKWFGFLRR